MEKYVGAKAAYQELRSAIEPWAKANGYRRLAGAQAGWQKPVNAEQRLFFKFEGYSMVNPDTGNSYYGEVQLEPLDARGSAILRQSPFSCCLVQEELDKLARIQGAINARRPPVPDYLAKDMKADTILGLGLRETYDPAPRYQLGQLVYFGYHSLQDAQELAAFIASVLPQALDRFLQGKAAKPVDLTPRHLRPKWLDKLGK